MAKKIALMSTMLYLIGGPERIDGNNFYTHTVVQDPDDEDRSEFKAALESKLEEGWSTSPDGAIKAAEQKEKAKPKTGESGKAAATKPKTAKFERTEGESKLDRPMIEELATKHNVSFQPRTKDDTIIKKLREAAGVEDVSTLFSAGKEE